VPLQPGMSLVADVHLRNRRFISSIAGGLDDRLRSLERMR
jgi:hemolysin D